MKRSPIPPLPSGDEILAAAHDLALRARDRVGGPLPPIRSQEWLDLDDDAKVASLLVLACAWLAEDPRQAALREMKEVSLAIHGGIPRGGWAGRAFRPAPAVAS